jgi:bacterioferritin-associated ferredoxin
MLIILICKTIKALLNWRFISPHDANYAMYVCLCNAVTEREVRHAAKLGATSLADLGESLGVATCCGKCADCARGILRDEVKKERIARGKLHMSPVMMRLQTAA